MRVTDASNDNQL